MAKFMKLMLISLLLVLSASLVSAITLNSPVNNSVVSNDGFLLNYSLSGSDRKFSFIDNGDLLLHVSFRPEDMSGPTISGGSYVDDRAKGYRLSWVTDSNINVTIQPGVFGNSVRWDNPSNAGTTSTGVFRLQYADAPDLFDTVSDMNNSITMCAFTKINPYLLNAVIDQGPSVMGFTPTSQISSGWSLKTSQPYLEDLSAEGNWRSVYFDLTGATFSVSSGSEYAMAWNEWSLYCSVREPDPNNSLRTRSRIFVTQHDGESYRTSYGAWTNALTERAVAPLNRFWIGSGIVSGTNAHGSMNGDVDEVFIFNRSLNNAEMHNLFDSSEFFLPPEVPAKMLTSNTTNTFSIVSEDTSNNQESLVVSFNASDIISEVPDPSELRITYPYLRVLNVNACHVYQRDEDSSGEGKVVVEVSEDISAIEYSYGDSPWILVNEPIVNGSITFNFRGVVGTDVLRVRSANNPRLTFFKENVAFGDVFVNSGQSNGITRVVSSAKINFNDTLVCTWQGSPLCGEYSDGRWGISPGPRDYETSGRDVSNYWSYIIGQETGTPTGVIGASMCGLGITQHVLSNPPKNNYARQLSQATNGSNFARYHVHTGSESDMGRTDFVQSRIDDFYTIYGGFHSGPVNFIFQTPGHGQTLEGKRTQWLIEQQAFLRENVFQGPSFYDVVFTWTGSNTDVHYGTNTQIDIFYERWLNAMRQLLLGGDNYLPPRMISARYDLNNPSRLRLDFDMNIVVANYNSTNVSSTILPETWLLQFEDYNLTDENIVSYEIGANYLSLVFDSSVKGGVLSFPSDSSWFNSDDQSQHFYDKTNIYSENGALALVVYNYSISNSYGSFMEAAKDTCDSVGSTLNDAFNLGAIALIVLAASAIVGILMAGFGGSASGFDIKIVIITIVTSGILLTIGIVVTNIVRSTVC